MGSGVYEGRVMRLRIVGGAAVLAALGVLLPGSALPVAQIQERDGVADFDSRTGKIAPTKHQRVLARKLRAKVSWGQFGTPASISRRGRFLTKGVRTKTPAGAARAWLRAHRGLFGLRSLDGIVLE